MSIETVSINKIGEENLFWLPFNYFDVVGIDNKALAEEVLSNQTRLTDNKNIPLYEDTVFNMDNGPQSTALLTAIKSLAESSELEIKGVWSQIHYPRESTGMHHHLPHQVAFVYYVSVPEGAGDLVFDLENKVQRNIPPVEGRLLMFHAWIMHRVSKNTGNKIRISISGNLS
jgi:hypothetical protein